MQVTETQAEGLIREFKIVIPSADVEKQVDAKLQELCAQVSLPGFRPGHVPMSLVRGKYGQSVLAEVVQKTLTETSQGLLKERKLRPAMQPHAEIVTFPDGKDLEFTLKIELIPQIDFMDFTKIELERLKPVIKEEDVSRALENAAASQRRFGPASGDRAAASGDMVVIDFVGKMDGKPFEGGAADGHQLELGSGQFIPGFEDQLIGAKAGEAVTVSLKMPEQYPAEDLAGKEVTFDVAVKEVQEPIPFAIDDELAKAFGVASLDELRTQMRASLEKEYQHVAHVREKRAFLDILATGHAFELPPGVVEVEFEAIWQQVQERRQQQQTAKAQGAEIEDEFEDMDEETMKKDYRRIAERRVRLGLLLSEIGSANDISLSQGDINGAIAREAQQHPGHEAQVFEYFQGNSEALQRLVAPIFEDKVVDFLLEKAKIATREVSPDELLAEVQATVEKAAGVDKKKTKTGKKAAKPAKSDKTAAKAPKKKPATRKPAAKKTKG
ncbi:MAG: trigger factor [Alphaproteobacteria bacterium]|nr:trigger factor [Alphaproteobacteria bacterium]